MKISKSILAVAVAMGKPVINRIGTAFGGTMLGWGATGEQIDVVLGALALIIGVAVDVMSKKLQEGGSP